MPKNMFDAILENLEILPIFSSSYETRLLTALITSSSPQTAADLSSSLSIPDSKVYPSLNFLEDKGLITIDDQTRPKKYYFDKPEFLLSYLHTTLDHQYQFHKDVIEEISEITKQIWEPEDFLLDNIALLYRGNEIRNELARHLKLTKQDLFIFLSTNFTDYYDLLQDYLPEISHDNFRLHLVIPSGHSDLLTHLEGEILGKVKVRTSIWNQNSYIIRDRKVMMNIFHSDQDVALLTNDELMVKNVEGCWNDPECCTSTSLVELQLPENFEFTTIKLE